jgi:hypothetical protein
MSDLIFPIFQMRTNLDSKKPLACLTKGQDISGMSPSHQADDDQLISFLPASSF